MYVWARLGRMILKAHGRGPYRFGEETRHSMRCWPTDVDNYGHMNNARYAMLCDIGRIEMFIRSGMWKLGKARNWWPLMGGVHVAFIREIKLLAEFETISSFDTWDDRQLLGRHRFVFPDGRTAAMVQTTVGVFDYTNRKFVPIDEVAEALGVERPRPPDEGELAFLRSQAALRELGKG